jgi:hypothetical protein
LREFARAVHAAPSPDVLDGLERELRAGERWLLPLCRALR